MSKAQHRLIFGHLEDESSAKGAHWSKSLRR
jgi:hypothetical protein